MSVIRIGFLVLLVLGLGLASSAVLADDGEAQALYDKKCAMCHGKDGVAKKMAEGSANLNDAAWQEATSVEDIVKTSTEGRGKMKGLEGKLTADEIKAVAGYVKTL